MLAWHKRWDKGHTPVTLGWSSSVPRLFVAAMEAIGNATNECEGELAERRRRANG